MRDGAKRKKEDGRTEEVARPCPEFFDYAAVEVGSDNLFNGITSVMNPLEMRRQVLARGSGLTGKATETDVPSRDTIMAKIVNEENAR